MKRFFSLLVVLIVTAACTGQQTISTEQLFPTTVGSFLRTGGPYTEPETGVESATYAGPEGTAMLQVRFVGEENVDYALNNLPALATNVEPDEALGERKGVFFTYGVTEHAAWGNGDWVFVLTASSDAARRIFIAGYGF
ncbi:MAG: hypothetical protein GYB64_15295 [Chloroflexi bacterium]|nr:hypothetical protein [Chloroflexota bacterium]